MIALAKRLERLEYDSPLPPPSIYKSAAAFGISRQRVDELRRELHLPLPPESDLAEAMKRLQEGLAARDLQPFIEWAASEHERYPSE